MRVLFLAALAATSSALRVQVHQPATVPGGWKQTSDRVPRGAVFHNIVVGLKRSNVATLDKLVWEVSEPGAATYLQYPTYAEMGELVRPAAAHTAAVKAWLAQHQVDNVVEHPHGDYVHFSATAAQLEAMAGGNFTTYVHTSGMTAHRITSGVHVDADVASAIDIFSGFHGFPMGPKKTVRKETVPKKDPTCAGCVVTPPFLRELYNVTKATVTKSGKTNIQAIAQYQGQYVSPTDLSSFCTDYDPASQSCTIAKFVGTNVGKEPGVESMLDTEYIVPIGNQTTWVYSYPDFDFCSDLVNFGSNVTSESTYPYVISISYGSQDKGFCEASLVTRFSQDIQKMSTMGITVMISSGDSGSGCNDGNMSPSYPASIPYAVAVGSTYFVTGNSGAEQATTQFGSGGGFSYDFDAPSYQTAGIAEYLSTVTLPTQYAYAKGGRGSPDVSALGEDFTVRAGGSDEGVGGTSASSPTFAGIVTLLNEECLSVSGKSLGFANPLFYTNPQAFRDVTVGTNAIDQPEGWAAIKGWDAATGLGTPNFPLLQQAVRQACSSAAQREQ